ncbi:plasmid replication protein RepC [Ochrobactrum sp. Marseille-Q0166]|uniref:plasmid replication protein RepC n=1 Tax=Ochrobactrum sp. Marseille-Q0166 TaxID=2761105 RepID=UPI001654DB30|nr:plasmid replication protein RepC [Ochrobactrum sp. Marseille-Q0166]MBC8719926.1 replication initiation protein [Ochrobactrum sp. Marseille-Q0166]
MQILESVTSALSRRMVKCALSQSTAEGIRKWELYKHLGIAKSHYGLNDRCLTVLNSLLSFLSEDVIASKAKLVVFPSNKQISVRAHMMAESTVRRHLASLIQAGLITRRDSPNCKRYAHKNRAGEVELAYGFDLSPFFARASEIREAAERILEEQRTLKRIRDEVSVIRRELAIAFERLPKKTTEKLFHQFRDVVDGIPRRATKAELIAIKASLEAIQSDLAIALKNNDNVSEMSGNGAQFERQHKESLSESLLKDQKEIFDLKVSESDVDHQQNNVEKRPMISLDLILRACPDIQSYSPSGIRSWKDLVDASRVVSSFLGISNNAYIDAVRVFGLQSASAAIACILQKIDDIASPGGYLRSLAQKARAGTFYLATLLFSELKVSNF